MKTLGYTMNVQQKRGPAVDLIGTGGTLIKFCRVLFGLLRDDAIIGHCFQYLILHVNFRIHMLTPVILYFAFEIAGEQLMKTYYGPMQQILLEMLKPNG